MNTRTTGTLSREDMEKLSTSRTHDQEVTGDSLQDTGFDMLPGGFPDSLGAGQPPKEGNHLMSVSSQHHKCSYTIWMPVTPGHFVQYALELETKVQTKLGTYLKNAIKSKTTLASLVDKIQPLSPHDKSCAEPLGEMCYCLQVSALTNMQRSFT